MTHDNFKNEPDFEDEVSAVLRCGAVMVLLERAKAALRDPRLQRAHRYVLAELIDLTHYGEGTAWPSRQTLAARAGITDGVLRNTLSELRAWGYVAWARRRREGEGRSLLHYVMPASRVDYATLTEAIRKLREEKQPTRLSPPAVTNLLPKASPQRVTRPQTLSPQEVTILEVSPREVQRLSPQAVRQLSPQAVQQELSTKELLKIDSEVASPTAPVDDTKPSATLRVRVKPTRGTRIPDDWSPRDNPEWGTWALTNYRVSRDQVVAELREFGNYWKGVTGAKGVKSNWFTTWQNRCRQLETYGQWKPSEALLKSRAADAEAIPSQDCGAPVESEVDRDLRLWREQQEAKQRE